MKKVGCLIDLETEDALELVIPICIMRKRRTSMIFALITTYSPPKNKLSNVPILTQDINDIDKACLIPLL